jgi:O-antigen/teichoic acid export membrane protein
VRQVATRPDGAHRAARDALLVLAAAGTLAAIALSLLLPVFGLALPGALLAVAFASAIVGNLQSALLSVLRGQERHARFAWLNAIATLAAAVAGLAVVSASPLAGAEGYLAALVAAGAVSLVLTWRGAGLRLRQPLSPPGALRDLVAGGLPFLGWNVVLRIRAGIDVILVGVLLREQVAGWLAASYRVISIPVFIPTLITTPLLPALSRAVGSAASASAAGSASAVEEYAPTVRRSLLLTLLLTVPISAIIFALAPHMPRAFGWEASYQNAAPLIMVLAFQQPLVALDMVLGTCLIALRRERPWLAVACLAAVFNVGANLVALPLAERLLANGAIGAAVVELLTEVVMLAGAARLLPRDLLDRRTALSAARLVAAGVVSAAAAWWLGQRDLPFAMLLAAAGGAVAYAAALFGSGAARPADITRAAGATRALLDRKHGRRAPTATGVAP